MEITEKIKILLKRYGASDEEIENFMQDLENFVEEKAEEVAKEKIEEVFDADEEKSKVRRFFLTALSG